ncbi:hypothetical protein OVS_04410 [Mycoplasma ovis str. Michigan]|uniref:Uncharacterized protein n=1 Tax=Mycoplasma ovis str. Michigan TaxID=1415773 RepID=A0ABM5P2F8_9MOLU|nr:DUF3713 domain-containing protein [Mycoplasma ovis]AHC40609.1 hypothetical protein OVS_04410 [Mycoplasma ovis str. Michigan]
MSPKWRKRLLWLLLPSFGGPTIGSVVATELNGNFGKINFKQSLKEEIGKFIRRVGGGNGTEGDNFTPVTLVSDLAKDPNSIPLLMRGFATQVAKHIFDGSLFKDKKYEQHKKHFSSHLRVVKAKADGLIKHKRKSKKRVKKNWVSDEEKYLSSLEDFVLGKIDTRSIESYYKLKENIFTPLTKVKVPKDAFSFIGFLMSRWLKEVKAGNFIHYILPYAGSFQKTTSELYEKKFTNIKLPDNPNFYFPDFDPKKLEDWKKIVNGEEGKKEENGKEKELTIKWVSASNTPQTNLVLKYLSEGNGSKNGLNGDQCSKETTKKEELLKLFCIDGNGGTEKSSNSVEFVVCNGKEQAKKQIFWRDERGFNVLLAHSNGKEKEKEEERKENFEKSKSQMVSEFKEYTKKNFSYLLLQYYLFINKNGCKNGKDTIPCCCKEVIESLVKLWKLNRELTELNDNLKIWDIRERNNSFFKVVDYSAGGANYLYKLGTVDANPPEFLKKVSKETKLEKISSDVSEHLKKVGEYFGKKSEGAQNQGKKAETVELKEKEYTGSGEHSSSKYWSFEVTGGGSKDHKECMKKQVAEFLLEKISTMDLLKKTLLLPFSFEKIFDLTQQIATEGQGTESANPLSKLEELLKKDYSGFFNFEDTSKSRKKREAPKAPEAKDKLINMLQKAIKEELSVSQLSNVSDTLLYKLSSETSESSKNGTDNFGAIKHLVTISNLSKQPLKTANTLERSQIRLLVTSLYLLEDSMKEYRELLKNIIKEQLFGGYAFSISWNKFCTQSDEKNPIDPTKELGNGGSSGQNSFWHPITSSTTSPSNGAKEWDAKTLDPRKCIRTPDRYSISTIKKTSNGAGGGGSGSSTTNSAIQLMGYKGSLTRNSQLQLPGDLYEKIISFLLKEGHINWTDITKQIDLIKSNRQLYSVIQQLSKINSSLGEIFKLPDYKNLKEDVDESKKVEMLEWLGLANNKELLKEFIQKNITKTEQVTQVSSSPENGTEGSKDKEAFSGLMWNTTQDQKKFVFSTKDTNEGSAAVYLIQYSANDVQSKENFAKFLKGKLTPDAVIKDIVKKAQDPGLQAKAINHYLMRGNYAGGKVYNLVSDDYYLKNQFSSIIL